VLVAAIVVVIAVIALMVENEQVHEIAGRFSGTSRLSSPPWIGFGRLSRPRSEIAQTE
jgi:hypothetical protein